MFKGKTALITGSSGFIGFSVAKKLLNDGWYYALYQLMVSYSLENKKNQRNFNPFMKLCLLKLALLRADVAYQRPHSFTLFHCVDSVRTATSLATSL